MQFAITSQTLTRKTARGTTKRLYTHCVHVYKARTWEGAHYKLTSDAWAALAYFNKRGLDNAGGVW